MTLPNLNVDHSAMAFPKRKWTDPQGSGLPECAESELQQYADELLAWKHYRFIRFPDGILRYIKLNTPDWFSAAFFKCFGGRPDNTVFIPLIDGYFLSFNLELKTQDKKGRAVGRLHGKQIGNAKDEGWFIARSPEAISAVIEKAEQFVERIKKIVAGGKEIDK